MLSFSEQVRVCKKVLSPHHVSLLIIYDHVGVITHLLNVNNYKSKGTIFGSGCETPVKWFIGLKFVAFCMGRTRSQTDLFFLYINPWILSIIIIFDH